MYYSADARRPVQQDGRGNREKRPPSGRIGLGEHERIALKLAGVAVAVVILLLVGLWWWERYNAVQVEEGDCVVGLDLTTLIPDERTALDEGEQYREFYTTWTREILQYCADRGVTRVRVFTIASDTARQDRAIERFDYKRFDSDSADGLEPQRDQRRDVLEDEVMPQVEELLASELETPGTDIVGAVGLAEETLRPADEVDYRLVWLLTDGVHNGADGVDVRDPEDGQDAVRQVVEQLVAEDVLAADSLAGVEVQMLGLARGGPSADMSDEQVTRMMVFWEEFFAVTGADVRLLRDGPEL